jgi:hypothetical protein
MDCSIRRIATVFRAFCVRAIVIAAGCAGLALASTEVVASEQPAGLSSASLTKFEPARGATDAARVLVLAQRDIQRPDRPRPDIQRPDRPRPDVQRPQNRPPVARPPHNRPPVARPPHYRPPVARPPVVVRPPPVVVVRPSYWRPWRPGVGHIVVASAITIAIASELRWCHFHRWRVSGMAFHSDVRCHRHSQWDHPSIAYVRSR